MFKSGIESLEQAINHFQIHNRTKEPKHLRFGLIHLDGSIELILKESLKNKGIHFLRGKGSGWYGVFECLWEIREDISRKEHKKNFPEELSDILYLNEMELLHELRNSAQHLGVYHSEKQLDEIIPKVLQALQAYMKLIFDLNIKELDEFLKNIGREKDPMELYLDEAESAFNQGNIVMAFLQKYIVLENLLNETLIKMGYQRIRNFLRMYSFFQKEILESESFMNRYNEEERKNMFSDFTSIREIRNQLLHDVKPFDEESILESYITLTKLLKQIMEVYKLLDKE